MQFSVLVFALAANVVSASPAPDHNNHRYCPVTTSWRTRTTTKYGRYTHTRTVTRTRTGREHTRTRTITIPGSRETETAVTTVTIPTTVIIPTTITEQEEPTTVSVPVTIKETETITLPIEKTTTLPAVTETQTLTLPVETVTDTVTVATGECTSVPEPEVPVPSTCSHPTPVENSGFESPEDFFSPWEEFTAQGGATGSAVDHDTTTPSNSGNYQFLVTIPRAAPGNAVYSFGQELSVCPGTTYDFSAWTRRPIPASGCVATYRIGGQTVATSPITIETTWLQAKGTWTAINPKARLVVRVQCTGSVPRGQVKELYIDDVELTVAAAPAVPEVPGNEDADPFA